MASAAPQTGYAAVNGLNMYYEIHGAGQPLVLLHGGFMTIDGWGELLPALATGRQVVGVEQQAHGHTADADRPLSYEQMADDTAALLQYLGIENADILGYSMGGGIALQLAIRNPELVRKLVVISATFNGTGMYPEARGLIATITPELFAGSPIETAYLQFAPDPDGFPALVEKIKQAEAETQDLQPELLRAISAPTLVMIGDSDIQPEHAVELFRLRGGGVMGDLAGLPASQLAILPATSHTGILGRSAWIAAMVTQFLDAPMPEAG